MALFAVNRFLGDEESDTDNNLKSRKPSDILAQLQAQAEKRKQEKLGKSSEDGQKRQHKVEEENEEEVPKKKKKKKKDKRKSQGKDESIDSELTVKTVDGDKDESHEEEKNEKQKKSKHKKKKHKHSESLDSSKQSDLESSLNELQDKGSFIEDISMNDGEKESDEDMKSDDDRETKAAEEEGSLITLEEGAQEIGGFTVLGDFKKKQRQQVHRVLPDWLSSPSVISADLRNTRLPVDQMTGLDSLLVEKLSENNITHFFPVQMQVIPELLSIIKHGSHIGPGGYRPNDICVSAPTGSGKTLAFVLPVIQALKDRVVRRVRAVVILPVKDLATQVYRVFQAYVQGTDLKVGLVVGQKTLQVEQQSLVIQKLRGWMSLVDIVVATPGRLVDHIANTEGFDLSHLRFLIIDEADRMMDDIKQDWLHTLEGAVYNQDGCQWGKCQRDLPGPLTVANCSKIQIPLQKLLFSATLSQNPEKLQHLNLFQPRLFTSVVTVTLEEEQQIGQALTGAGAADSDKMVARSEFIGKFTTPMELSELYVRVTAAEKPLVVLHFLNQLHYRNVLCFTNTREATHRLYLLVKQVGGVKVQEFSSNLSVKKRDKIIHNFSKGKIDLLICSDAMARGMDVENVEYVISYDTTPHIKTYIHRIGRTARAGKTGTAITFLENKEVYHFKKMVQEAGKTRIKEMSIKSEELSPLVDTFQDALKQLPQLLVEERKKKKQKG